jgi:hypothetical protein
MSRFGPGDALHAVGVRRCAHDVRRALASVDDDLDMTSAIARFLRKGIDDGAFRVVDAHTIAAFLSAIVHTAGDAIAAGDPPDRWRQAVRDLTRCCLTPLDMTSG